MPSSSSWTNLSSATGGRAIRTRAAPSRRSDSYVRHRAECRVGRAPAVAAARAARCSSSRGAGANDNRELVVVGHTAYFGCRPMYLGWRLRSLPEMIGLPSRGGASQNGVGHGHRYGVRKLWHARSRDPEGRVQGHGPRRRGAKVQAELRRPGVNPRGARCTSTTPGASRLFAKDLVLRARVTRGRR